MNTKHLSAQEVMHCIESGVIGNVPADEVLDLLKGAEKAGYDRGYSDGYEAGLEEGSKYED